MDLEILKWAAQLGGGWIAFIVLLILHREDRQRRNELDTRLLEVIEKNAKLNEKLVGVVEQLGDGVAEHHRIEGVWMDKLSGVLSETRQGVATLVEKANAETWARKAAP